MYLKSQSFQPDRPIPAEFAFGKIHPTEHFAFSDNKNPHLEWGDVPEGTRSFALFCIDTDVPTVADDVNQEGRSVSRELPRTEFVHWVMVDIPPGVREIGAGSCSDGVTPGGKQDPPGPAGSRQGVTNYTEWFAGDADMGGTYRGYDGPAPPWNDELVHHYHFELHALDVAAVDVRDDFRVDDVRAAIRGHVLGHAKLTGTYTLNRALQS